MSNIRREIMSAIRISSAALCVLVLAPACAAADLDKCQGSGRKYIECVERNLAKVNGTLEKTIADLREEVKTLEGQVKELTDSQKNWARKSDMVAAFTAMDRSFTHVRLKGWGVKECIFQAAPHGIALKECSAGVGSDVEWTLERFGK
jgi:hypothetical protein